MRRSDPAARGAHPGSPVLGASPQARFESALARFNASESGRLAAGLTRTLGPPEASVGAVAGSASEVRVTVAWELCWYQWGVDLVDEKRAVYELARGSEVDELDPPARQWNACVDAGRVVLGSRRRPPRRR